MFFVVGRVREVCLCGLFHKGTNVTQVGSLLVVNLLPKALLILQVPSHFGHLDVTYEFVGDANTESRALCSNQSLMSTSVVLNTEPKPRHTVN